jgi:hypothetical protein
VNESVIKRAAVFSLILGACIGIVSILPFMIGFTLFALMFLVSPIIIIYMKKGLLMRVPIFISFQKPLL